MGGRRGAKNELAYGEMGYSKNVSEKALFMTGGKSVEAAMGWITDNQGAPDFEEQLFMVNKH